MSNTNHSAHTEAMLKKKRKECMIPNNKHYTQHDVICQDLKEQQHDCVVWTFIDTSGLH